MSRSRRMSAAVAALAIAVGITLAAAGPAVAHNQVLASVPAAGETLTALPEVFSITTDQTLLDLPGGGGFAVDIRDAEGAHYGDGCSTVVDTVMSTPATLGEPGEYTVVWQFVSADGHTLSTEIPFTWAPAGDVAPATGAASAGLCGEAGDDGPPPSSAPEPPRDSRAPLPLGDVLWIGGAVLAVLVATAVTLLVLTRRRRG